MADTFGSNTGNADIIYPPSVPLAPFYSNTLNGDFAANGVGLRNVNQAKRGIIDMSGLVPAGSTIVKAFLYWSYLRENTKAPNPTGLFNSTLITGTPVAIAIGDPCWPNVDVEDVFRADVTGLANTGINTLTAFPSGVQDNSDPAAQIIPPLLEGASLVIIYANESLPRKTIIINEGGVTFSGQTVSTLLSGFRASSSPSARTAYIVADGQANIPLDQAFFNNTAVAGPGTNVKPEDAFNGQDGIGVTGNPAYGLWDTLVLDVSSLVAAGDASAEAAIVSQNDCLTYIAQVFSVTAGGEQPSKTFINNSAATLQITLFLRQGTNPVNQDGTVSFNLAPFERRTVSYGDAENPFLNGLILTTLFDNDLYSKAEFVLERSSELDNLLNTNDFISFSKILTDYVTSGFNA
ncbi:DUF3344 domain-containing protein [Metabacillus sp. GX 13764]|uniref:DUF3344 domain-containing protein n=1 Tax=Metabacillus kandeliae TaxID=2900151 RepID=UPI001E38A9FF|nr:DUF3344 domain-containing protein [Metabacillus kandeliae]MCD7035148.1 DUF3344 domain-containing protein [Metabacillus kandeliae]